MMRFVWVDDGVWGGSSVEQPDKLLIKIKYLIIKNKMPYG